MPAVSIINEQHDLTICVEIKEPALASIFLS